MEEVAELIGNAEVKLLPKQEYIGKNDGWGFQFLNENYEAMHPPACCKDFLQDVVYIELTQDNFSIYNFVHKYQGFLKDKELLRLSLYWTNSKVKVNAFIEPLNKFLNDIEDKLGYQRSNVYLDKTELIIIIDFSSKWISKPYMFSLFTLLARKGIYYNGDLEGYLFSKENKSYLESNDTYNLVNEKYKQIINKIINKELELIQPNWEEFKNYKSPSGGGNVAGNVHQSGLFSLISLNKSYKIQEL